MAFAIPQKNVAIVEEYTNLIVQPDMGPAVFVSGAKPYYWVITRVWKYFEKWNYYEYQSIQYLKDYL